MREFLARIIGILTEFKIAVCSSGCPKALYSLLVIPHSARRAFEAFSGFKLASSYRSPADMLQR